MLFNSVEFVLFFAIVLWIYPRLALGAQNWLILLASCVFYAWWDWRYLGLVAFSAVIDYFVALQLEREQREAVRSRLLLVSLTTNLGVLGVFKYYDFFAESARELLTAFGFRADDITLKLVLPVGISFYTFQSLSYTIDVYRRQLAPCRNFRDFAVFIMFFPQLVAGPIERATHLLPQVMRPRRVTLAMIREGIWLLLFGYYKKTRGQPLAVHGPRVW
jgi:alginate O-acetyltransferase complex protein AlgI